MNSKRLAVVLVAMLVVTVAAQPVAAQALSVSAVQTSSGATVSVTDNGTAVEGATVEVTADGNYSDTGTHTTDANGSVDLAAPTETVNLTVVASHDNRTASTTVRLVADDGDATAGNETNTTDGNETLENGTTEGTLTANFGQQLNAFIDDLDAELAGDANATVEGASEADVSEVRGRLIAAWVVANNPGNAPDHAGPKHRDDEAEETDEDDEDETDRGRPDHARGNGHDDHEKKDRGHGHDEHGTDRGDDGDDEDDEDDSDDSDEEAADY